MTVIPLPANRPPDRFYRGGTGLAELRGDGAVGEYEPEDWVGSATTVHGEAPTGLTRLPDGRYLRAAIEADPQWWLGPDHVAAYGADAMLLVKLLDAGERLPVHAHPDRAFAKAHFAASHGKTEAWFLLTGGSLHLALKEDLSADELAAVLERQDAEEILGLMHEVQVNPGDVVLVPAGVLHAIGGGLLLVELQEPEDFSLMLEWKGYPIDGPNDGHLGIGYDLALQAMERRARTRQEIAELVRPAGFGPSVFPAAADPYFRLGRERVQGEIQVEAGFAVVIVLSGQVAVTGRDSADGRVTLKRGATAVAPHAAGELSITGEGEVLICRPPAATR
ncbi:class I mannose-6-phosphate isomerase [Ruania halotolerans]|uniref:class I mannose-6-phosphate isomerase n=1 Tax=Ruania halotolerans TaxID=2897773 RepID=UPI001E4122EF|nr:class I mannose-6-phosphate isomerase [Ruania halotolerans]UFU08016.1 class I mannose-6-phosphate isomerase [Ruania halotolerans]